MKPVWLIRLQLSAVAVVCALVFVPWAVGYAAFSPLRTSVQEEVDSAARRGLDGIIVYVDCQGKEPALYAAGWKDKSAKLPADPRGLFKIGSVSKLYIAAATAKLVADGRLSLDGTLAHYLPELNGPITNADQITLRMLLQHRSGIPNFTDDPDFNWSRLNSEDMLGLVVGEKADFAPNSRYRYSNTNYLLIGRILDKTLGYTHRDYIRAEILTPLGLKRTYGRLADAPFADVATGYAIGYGGELKTLDYTIPGGSMVASAEDTGAFVRALNDGSLLGVDAQAIFTSISPYDHTGLLPGYQSFARHDKNTDTVIIVFVSTSGGNAWLRSEALYTRIVRFVRKK